MNLRYMRVVSFVVAAVLLVGCNSSSQLIAPALQLSALTFPEEGVTMTTMPPPLPDQQPMLDHLQLATTYSMIVVRPNPNIDYKIVTVTPDPAVDYKIVIVNPNPATELSTRMEKQQRQRSSPNARKRLKRGKIENLAQRYNRRR